MLAKLIPLQIKTLLKSVGAPDYVRAFASRIADGSWELVDSRVMWTTIAGKEARQLIMDVKFSAEGEPARTFTVVADVRDLLAMVPTEMIPMVPVALRSLLTAEMERLHAELRNADAVA